MKTATLTGIALAALCGCAQTSNMAYSSAEQNCAALARADGMRVNQAQAGDAQVRMQLEDALGRRFEATCSYSSSSGARWQTPLPTNAVRR